MTLYNNKTVMRILNIQNQESIVDDFLIKPKYN